MCLPSIQYSWKFWSRWKLQCLIWAAITQWSTENCHLECHFDRFLEFFASNIALCIVDQMRIIDTRIGWHEWKNSKVEFVNVCYFGAIKLIHHFFRQTKMGTSFSIVYVHSDAHKAIDHLPSQWGSHIKSVRLSKCCCFFLLLLRWIKLCLDVDRSQRLLTLRVETDWIDVSMRVCFVFRSMRSNDSRFEQNTSPLRENGEMPKQ